MIGNGYCNDETNNAECNYDGGDCCGTCVVTQYCSDCQCLGEVTGNGLRNALGNGYCDDETNNEDCNYDGGDCCLSSPNTDLCSDCACSTTGVITSPGYPGNYANNLDVSWHIQVPSGKLIGINFISFGVWDCSSCR